MYQCIVDVSKVGWGCMKYCLSIICWANIEINWELDT